MRTLLLLLVLRLPVAAQTAPARRVSYSIAKKSVQDVVIDLAKEAGLGYNWQKSAAQTDPERRRFLRNLRIQDEPFDAAMARVLAPIGLRYEIKNNQVVLYRRER